MIVCEAPLVSLMLGLSGSFPVIFGMSSRGAKNGSGGKVEGKMWIREKEKVRKKIHIQNSCVDVQFSHLNTS